MGIWFDGMTLSDMWTKKPAYLFLTRLWRLPVIAIWSWGSELSQFLGIFASLSVFGFCLSNPSERAGMQHLSLRWQEAHRRPPPHMLAAARLLPLWLGLPTGSLVFSIPGKMQILLWAFMSCYTWVPLINPSLGLTIAIHHSSKKGDIRIGSSRWGTTEAMMKLELGIWGFHANFSHTREWLD